MLRPDIYLPSILQITPKLLKDIKVVAVVVDVDNTIKMYRKFRLLEGVLGWVEAMKKSGFLLVIASNNFKKNVEPIAKILGIPYVSLSFKPLPIGLSKAAKILGVEKQKIAIIGDQFFTDVVGGKLKGFKTVLVNPISLEDGFFWSLRRKIEKKILHKILKKR